MLKKILLSFLALTSCSVSRDLGQSGSLFKIAEESLLEVIQGRLTKLQAEGKLAALQQDLQQKAKAAIERPAPVPGILKARRYRRKVYDPTFVSTGDIQDHKGTLIVKKGTAVNPLEKISFGDPLIFIDGDDSVQVHWSLSQTGKIVLVRGAPLALEQKYRQPFYFDQGGVLTEKLGITEVPARVSQKERYLLIESTPVIEGKENG